MVDPMLEYCGLRHLFGSVVDWGRTRRHKPNPEPVLVALEELEVVPAEDVWYIGDSSTDCEAARGAGISFAWAAYGYAADEPDGADKVIHAIQDALTL
jgi:phosphoglycolate phosphatase-like HAD superfamily hydrolase